MLFCLLTLYACAGDSLPDRGALLDSLVESERAFSRAAAEQGIRDAFIANLAADAVIFRPRALNAQDWLGAQPAQPGLLAWEPALADVSAFGDLGFTTGPWDFSPEPDGTWKVVIDHGITSPPPTEPEQLHSPDVGTADPRWRADDATLTSEREALLQVDRAFSEAGQAEGVLETLGSYVVPYVRVLRNVSQPLYGIEALQLQLTHRSGVLSWDVLGGDLSLSADLAYTYGEYSFTASGESEPEEVGNYVRAWRRQPDGAWRITVDLMTPLP
jgi:ketosteroid isomerase-like protein